MTTDTTVPVVAGLLLPPPPPPPPEPPTATAGDGDDKPERMTASTRLVHLAEAQYALGATEDGEPFAHTRTGPLSHVTLPLRGGRLGLRAALAADYFDTEGKAAPQAALADALNVLEGKARRLPPTQVHLRVAEAADALWIDAGDDLGTVIEVRGGAWRITREQPPVMFRRTELTVPMDVPIAGGDPRDLFGFLNVAPEDRTILLAVLVAAFLPDIPHPIPTFTGEQGTGKSTAASMLVELLDPSAVPLRKGPRDADTFVTGATGSWVVAYDNLSAIPEWLSDALCRGVTGDGDVRRQLYTDGGLAVFRFRRQFILTGIDFAGLRGDLAERLVLVELQRIAEHARQDEQTLRARWGAARPRVLGALLDLTAKVHALLPSVRLDSMPRMADFARVLAAVDQLTGSEGFARYRAQSAEIAADTLAASPFIERLAGVRLDHLGTAAELLETLAPADPEQRLPKGWPANARAVTSDLRRNAPALRKNGWTVDPAGETRDHTKRWHVVHPERQCIHHPQHPQAQPTLLPDEAPPG